MRAGEAAGSAGVSVKALRYYEAGGLLRPARRANGYRDYTERDIRLALRDPRCPRGASGQRSDQPDRTAPTGD